MHTIKETLIAALRVEGLDIVSACVRAVEMIAELRDKPAGTYTLHTKSTAITIRKA